MARSVTETGSQKRGNGRGNGAETGSATVNIFIPACGEPRLDRDPRMIGEGDFDIRLIIVYDSSIILILKTCLNPAIPSPRDC